MPLPEHADELLKILAMGSAVRQRKAYLDTLAGQPPKLGDFLKREDLTGPMREDGAVDRSALIEDTKRWLEHENHHVIPVHSGLFPPMLKRTSKIQLALFVDGDPAALWFPSIAVVGSRNPSWQGRDNTDFFVEGLVQAGLLIVSGLAHGIDSRAHEATLRYGGIPIGVLGTGPDVIYPANNRRLQREVAERGALVTEYFPGTKPARHHFPARNQIIAGLSVATLLVEGRDGSGATGTASAALEAGRDVFAIPGSIHNPLYKGNHKLIRDGAVLAQSIPEVLEELRFTRAAAGEDFRKMPPELKAALQEPFETDPVENPFDHPDYNTLWRSIDDDPTDMGTLVQRTGLTFAQVSVILVELESEGKVINLDGRYHKVRKPTALSGAGRGK